MHILQCMGSKFCVKFQRAPLKFYTKFWTNTPKTMHFSVFSFCVWVTISLNCDIISLSETGPRSYKVLTDNGAELCRARKHLRKATLSTWPTSNGLHSITSSFHLIFAPQCSLNWWWTHAGNSFNSLPPWEMWLQSWMSDFQTQW